ncbi:ISAon1 family transposase N-terminal region protein [Dyadobacter diqingensis]|uniref:ISAon1 family transposase N-terminal region protein n=1 Tax=Dyadobacter diqingensis TaxID=2938121 RepID=UPI0020C4DE89|nr:transposase [Dyadobacter diqingensis]
MHPELILIALKDSYQALVSLLLPEGILEYFELAKVVEAIPGLNIYLEEKNITPEKYKDEQLESKGFLPEIYVQDFPIRNQKVTLCIKRRRWEVKDSGEIVSRDWKVVQQGTRITKEFADFLKPGRRADLYR